MSAGPADNYRWSSAFETHAGHIRQLNEDAVLDRPDIGVWAVADGMGGHAGGDRASRLVIDALASLPCPDRLDELVESASGALKAVNTQLHDEARRNNGAISGSTVVALLVRGRHGAILWAGDSRVYLYRNGGLRTLSRDHSQVEEWVSSGLLPRNQAGGHPAANVITRAIGAAGDVELDTVRIDILPGDRYLLCSDGLHNEVDEQTLSRILAEGGDCRQAADRMLTSVLNGEARDNVSLVVAQANAQIGDSTRTVVNPVVTPRRED